MFSRFRFIAVITVLLSLLVVGFQTAHAHSFVEMSIDYLAQHASRVVVATPEQAISVWEEAEGGKRIVTYHRSRVQTNVVGDGEQEIWIRRLGGVVGEVGQLVHGTAPLRTGQPALLFLMKRKDGTFSVIGMEQGYFPVVESKDKSMKISSRRFSHAPIRANRLARPASLLEGLSFQQAKELIIEARQRHAK